MYLYRIYPHLTGAKPGAPGSPTYLHRPQGNNRLDNPADYDAWYFGLTPEAAAGEVFGDLAEWREDMFTLPALPGARKVLGRYRVEDQIAVLDLDDANNLLTRHLRPTQVIARNRPVTQRWAKDIHAEGIWAGVRWWSFQRPHWTIFCLWTDVGAPCPATFVDNTPLDLEHPAIVDAAASLGKTRHI